MVATTRTKTGNLPAKIENAVEAVAPTKKRTTTANTSKPRDKKVASGRVDKKAPATKKTATPKLKTVKKEKAPATKAKDKVEGKVEKAKAKVEAKPEKKAAGTKKEKSTTTKKVAAPKTKKA
ncbi:hypothetical protein BU26DRAFT_522371 [Trematosphaeria pertusa]|uniref:Uncharacterized protein n=1 Tax=Trematosphaeria pertusa TaxID=390896 RepID=A0A6A6I309_9PLEO|nr:uncharacterized protein BU26DRAFT_522371 [Trematosphaeria pertusa]KAF2244549.1 hypothetical protein BU26DRAFT_522371 [Trematosphaeria pertusa]